MTLKNYLLLEDTSTKAIYDAIEMSFLIYHKRFTSEQYVVPLQSMNMAGANDPIISPELYNAENVNDHIVLNRLNRVEAYVILNEVDDFIMFSEDRRYIRDSLDEKLLNEYKNTF
ncbi:MAG: hypothetical protein ACQESE_01705 [Nanobdellota archaeon]